MENDRTIQIDTLRRVINGILDFIEKDLGISDVNLQKDNYWTVLEDTTPDAGKPTEFGVGSLNDDWGFLLSSAKDKDQQLPIMLIHVAPILQALSQAVPSYTSPREAPGAKQD